MRLWHQDLLSKLPQKQICGQWRECIALLGNGWGKKHSVVNYVFEHDEAYLVAFAYLVYKEMMSRGYNPNQDLIDKALLKRHTEKEMLNIKLKAQVLNNALELLDIGNLYEEHNEEYYNECIENLKEKGIEIK